jgi:hypothetical protein
MLAYADATMLLPETLSYEQAAPISVPVSRFGLACGWRSRSPESVLL